jgi:SAM-dependent methyltransferase
MNNFYQEKNSKLIFLLDRIEKQGYSDSINEFINKYPEFSYRFDKKQGSVLLRSINGNNTKCLVINSDLGNIPEFLSTLFEKVVSIDIEEKILIQIERFKDRKINNVQFEIFKSNNMSNLEKDFDLIVLNDIKIKNHNSQNKIQDYLNNIKEFLNDKGCLCVAVQNKTGIKVINEEVDSDTYSNNFNGYNLLLNSLGLHVDSYWALPSHNQANHSGKISDDVSLKWFFHNFDKKFFVDKKFKIVGKFLKTLNKKMRELLLIKFCPSFLFYCYKDKSYNTLEYKIRRDTGYDNIIQHIRPSKTLYFLLNNEGNPEKVVTCNHTKYDLTEKIFEIDRNFPGMKITNEKISIENWLDGVPLDRSNHNDLKLVMNWLKTFQNKTKNEFLDMGDIEQEIEHVKNELDLIPEISKIPYENWLDDYKHEFIGKKIQKTAVHGDFQVRNILIDHQNLQVNIIDWDWRYEEKGNPIYDFIWLATNIMMLSKNFEKEFEYGDSQSNEIIKLIKIIENTMKDHLQVNFDFIKLQKFMILRFLTIRIKQGDNGHLLYIDILKILSKNTN